MGHSHIILRTLPVIAVLLSRGMLAQKRSASDLLHQAALRGQTASISGSTFFHDASPFRTSISMLIFLPRRADTHYAL